MIYLPEKKIGKKIFSLREGTFKGKVDIKGIKEVNWKANFNVTDSFPGSTLLLRTVVAIDKGYSGRSVYWDRNETDMTDK